MGLLKEKDILEKVYNEFPYLNKKQVKALIKIGNSKLIRSLSNDVDVIIKGNPRDDDSVIFFSSMLYGDLSWKRVKDKHLKEQNRRNVNNCKIRKNEQKDI